MNFHISSLTRQMQEAYNFMINDDTYSSKGFRRYRIFNYIYHFGCIQVHDLAYLFPDDLKRTSDSKVLINSYRAMLNYFCNQKLLEKLNDGFYTLNSKGLKSLYEHLKQCSLIIDIDQKNFLGGFNKKTVHLSHSSKIGRAVHAFVSSYHLNFLHEPLLDDQGNLLSASFKDSSARAVLPDALLYKNDSDVYYLEADSSSERINSVISKKINNYCSIFLTGLSTNTYFTLQFSVWNKSQDSIFPSLYSSDVDLLLKLYYFMSSELRLNMEFSDYVNYLLEYQGDFKPALSCKDFLLEIGTSKILSKTQLEVFINKKLLYQDFNNSFKKRQSGFFDLVKHKSDFIKCLQHGNRFVFYPLNANNKLLNCVYIEHISTIVLEQFFRGFFNENIRILETENCHKLCDNSSGYCYYFRNYFLLKSDNKILHLVIENISDDFGGRLRVRNFLADTRSHFIRDLYLLCLYNSHLCHSPQQLVSETDLFYENMFFVPYEDFVVT